VDVFRNVVSERGVGKGVPVDEEGFFEAGLEPGPYEVTIRAAGYQAVRVGPRTVDVGKSLDWGTIELEPKSSVSIDIHVLNSAGRAVAGAEVRGLYFPSQPLVSTDAGGKGTLVTWEWEGRAALQTRHSEYLPSSHPVEWTAGAERLAVTITLRRGGTVVGRAYDEDRSIAGWTHVSLEPVAGVQPAIADQKGRFSFDDVTPGQYWLRMPERASDEFTVLEGQTVEQDAYRNASQDARTPRRGLRGIVMDADGNPVAGCEIHGHGRDAITTDAEGRFVLSRDAPRALHALTPWGQVVKFGLPNGREEVTLRLPGELVLGTVRGEVRDSESGELLVGATVSLSTAESATEETVLRRYEWPCGLSGTFEMEVPAGHYRLEVQRAGNATELRTIQVEGGLDLEINVSLVPAGSLAFLVDCDCEWPPSRVTLEARLSGEPQDVRRIENGFFGSSIFLTNLRRGATYQVAVRAADYETFSGAYEVVAGELELITVTLRSDGEAR
jgi:hypothetical protein